MMCDIVQRIKDASKIALIAHIMPDGDTLGSCLGLSYILKKINKEVHVFCESDYPSTFSFLKGSDTFKKPEDRESKYDLVIALDCSDRGRMGGCSVIMDEADVSINIDHHISNTYYADINEVDPNASATAEIVFDLIFKLTDSIDIDTAEALYTAITTDTGSFSFSNTTAKTHYTVAQLMGYGINVDKISTLLFRSRSLTETRLLALALNNLEMYYNNKMAVITISMDDMDKVLAKENDIDGIINFAKEIIGVELGVLIREIEKGKVKVGFRSKDKIDVNSFAIQFGGGGHKRAAGCVINENLNDSKRKIIDSAAVFFKEQKGN